MSRGSVGGPVARVRYRQIEGVENKHHSQVPHGEDSTIALQSRPVRPDLSKSHRWRKTSEGRRSRLQVLAHQAKHHDGGEGRYENLKVRFLFKVLCK